MKRILSILLILTLCLSFCACGQSKEAKNVETMIDSIGNVTVNSGTIIEHCRAAYDALSAEDKASVSNYYILVIAEETYAKVRPVTLSAANIDKYLSLSFDYEEGELWYMLELYATDSELTFQTNSMAHGHFEDAQVTVKIELNNEDWAVDTDDPAYWEDDPDNLYVTFRLPANGEYRETHIVHGSEMFSMHSDLQVSQLTYSFVDASGQFIPAG